MSTYGEAVSEIITLRRRAEDLADEVIALRAQKNGAYGERNKCVALLARMALRLGWDAGIREHPSDDTSWEQDWRTIVMIDLPSGQASWHFHDSEKHLLAGLPRYLGGWDGHTTDEKYRRVADALPPCGGSRCFRHSVDGIWIHSSKSYSTCIENREDGQ